MSPDIAAALVVVGVMCGVIGLAWLLRKWCRA